MIQLLKTRSFKNHMITSAIIVAGSIGMLAGHTQNASAFGVGVQPSTVEMTIKPGDRHRQVVTVGNVHKTQTISLTMGLADWSLDENGKLDLSPPGETERSGANWVRFSPASVTLKPETSQDVVVEISVPYKVANKGDHRFALLATTMLPELDKRGDISGVWNRYQLASLFYLTLSPSESTPKVTNASIKKDDATYLAMVIENDGDAHARLKGNAYIRNDAGEIVAETPLSTVVLNQSKRNYNVKLDDLAGLQDGVPYKIDFKLQNSFAPQNKFKAQDVDVPPVTFTMQP